MINAKQAKMYALEYNGHMDKIEERIIEACSLGQTLLTIRSEDIKGYDEMCGFIAEGLRKSGYHVGVAQSAIIIRWHEA